MPELVGFSHIDLTVMDCDSGYGPTLVFRDPDNTQLELYVEPSLDDLTLTDADSDEARRGVHSAR